jgi:hypothetical protein
MYGFGGSGSLDFEEARRRCRQATLYVQIDVESRSSLPNTRNQSTALVIVSASAVRAFHISNPTSNWIMSAKAPRSAVIGSRESIDFFIEAFNLVSFIYLHISCAGEVSSLQLHMVVESMSWIAS